MRLKIVSIITAIFLMAVSAFSQDKIYKNSIGMEFVVIPSGSFMMGADKNFEKAQDNEMPRHKVTISKPFYLSIHEVTQTQWVAVMGINPSHFKERDNPVEHVSWDDVQKFISKLNEKENTNRYRLPTEAEWEYAARAGSVKTYGADDDFNSLKNKGWLQQNSKMKTHAVGLKEPNAWGLYDMQGNVFEWVQDIYADNYNVAEPINPQGAVYGSNRCLRGGSWLLPYKDARVALRSFFPSDEGRADIGFRIAINAR